MARKQGPSAARRPQRDRRRPGAPQFVAARRDYYDAEEPVAQTSQALPTPVGESSSDGPPRDDGAPQR